VACVFLLLLKRYLDIYFGCDNEIRHHMRLVGDLLFSASCVGLAVVQKAVVIISKLSTNTVCIESKICSIIIIIFIFS
jgi:hypothetical protein